MIKKIIYSFICFYLLFAGKVNTQPPFEEWPKAGLNLEWQELMLWTQAIPFNNLFKIANPFSGAATYDSAGYPLTGFPAMSEVYYGENLPDGTYTLKWDGNGTLTLFVDDTEYFYSGLCPEKGEKIEIDNRFSFIKLEINETNSNNHLRNLRFYLPGYDDSSPHQFNDCFLSTFESPVDVIRPMWWARVPDSDITEWSARPKVYDYTYGGDTDDNKGTAYEHMVDICNITNSHLWIGVPVKANDNFITQLANLIKNRLADTLNIFVEYSNESPWHYWYEYHNNTDAADVGLADYNGDDGAIYASHKYAARASEVMQLFDDAFGEQSDRLIGVLGAQSGWTPVLQQGIDAVEYLGRLDLFDAFSPAPYIGDYEPVTENWPDMDAVFDSLDVYVQGIMDGRISPGASDDKGHPFSDFVEIAEKYDKKLVAYEAGQHFTSWNPNLSEEQIVAINTHPRIYSWFQHYINGWFSHAPVTSTIVFYTSHTPCPSGGSCFGVKTACDQPIETAHKYRGIINWFTKESDFTAPGEPSNLVALNTTSTTITLDWDASADSLNLFQYIIYQDGSPIDSTGSTQSIITGLTAETDYSFYVTTIDVAGNESQPGNTVHIKTTVGMDIIDVSNSNILLYPNPVTEGILNIVPDGLKIKRIKISDANGKIVKVIESIQSKDTITINVEDYKGEYIILLETNKGRIEKKAVVLK